MNFSLKQKKRSAVSPVIATLLLIAIAVAAAIIVYAFVTGLIGGLSAGGSSSLVTLTGSVSVPNGTGAGVVVLTVRNSANSPIQTVVVNAVVPNTLSPAPTGITVSYAGSLVTSNGVSSNLIPIGGTASGAYSFTSGGVSGTGYTFTVTVTFANGSTQIQTLDITAQI